MFKKIVLIACFLISSFAFTQNGTSSPYSFYGIGDVRFKGTVENRSMAGLAVFRDSIHLNLQNPASLSRLIYTTFTVGGGTSETVLSTNAKDNKAKSTTVDYIGVGFPIGKFGVNVNLTPYTSVGYNITNLNPTSEIAGKFYEGSGGINKVTVGVGYNVSNNLSVGLNIESNFGKITTNSSTFLQDVEYGTREFNESVASGIAFSTGAMYNTTLKGKLQFSGSATFTPSINLKLINQRTFFREQFLQAINENTVSIAAEPAEFTLKLPMKYSFGFGLGKNRKWQVGIEFLGQNNSNFGNRFNDISNARYENGSEIKIGGYFVPKYNSFSSYFQRMTYRGGFNYQKTGLIINNKSINNQVFSLGLGLPLGGSISNLNIGFEFGKRGTKLGGLVSETYNNLIIGLSLNDKWFNKRKFD